MKEDNRNSNHDQIASGGGPGGSGRRPGCVAGLLVEVLPARFHAAPALRSGGPQDFSQDRLSRSDADAAGLQRPARRSRPRQDAPLLDALQGQQTAAKKGEPVFVLVAATARAQDSGLIDARPEAAVDATGLDSQHTSRYYFARSGKKHSARLWTKLTVVCHTGSHFFTSATVSTGPSNDGPQFAPAMKKASLVVAWDRVLGDAAFDSEENHRLCREDLGIRSTVIPVNRRSQGRKWPKTKYRRQMKRRFHRRQYGQRCQP